MSETGSPGPQSPRDRRSLPLVMGALLIATLLFRVPPLMNARDVNSDAAVVGLQAMHMLHGEWSWFLWGAGYQSSLDSAITAVAFAIFGASPLVLMMVPIVGHLILMYLALVVLKKRIGLGPATICILTLVITPSAINSVIISPPRQWSITLIFLSIWLLDGASESGRWSLVRFALGVLWAALAVFVDLYALVFMPGIALLALMCLTEGTSERKIWLRRAAACGVGAAIGAAAVVSIRLASPAVAHRILGADFIHIRYRLGLLWHKCLPFSLGYKLFQDSENPFARTLWAAPMPWYLLQLIGGWSLIAGMTLGGVMFLRTKLPWGARRLGLFGVVVAATTALVFVVSMMPVDMWAVRYLGPVFWMAPFALAPLAASLRLRRLAVAIAPYLIVAAVGGWLSYGFYVHGPLPRNYAGPRFEREEQQVCDFLRSRGIRYAGSDYWFAYRFSFVFQENPVILPIDPAANRYAPYLDEFLAEKLKAWVFHPTWSRRPMERYLDLLRKQHVPFTGYKVGDFTVIVFPEAASKPAPAAAPASGATLLMQAPPTEQELELAALVPAPGFVFQAQ